MNVPTKQEDGDDRRTRQHRVGETDSTQQDAFSRYSSNLLRMKVLLLHSEDDEGDEDDHEHEGDGEDGDEEEGLDEEEEDGEGEGSQSLSQDHIDEGGGEEDDGLDIDEDRMIWVDLFICFFTYSCSVCW